MPQKYTPEDISRFREELARRQVTDHLQAYRHRPRHLKPRPEPPAPSSAEVWVALLVVSLIIVAVMAVVVVWTVR